MTKVFVYEENGKPLLSDRFGRMIMVFASPEAREKFIGYYLARTGKRLEVVEGKPDIMNELAEGLDVTEEEKDRIGKKYGLQYPVRK